MSKILLDGRFIGVGESMSRYALELFQGVLALDHENEYTLLLQPRGEKELLRYPQITAARNSRIVALDIPHYSLSEQTKLWRFLQQARFDLVHFTQFNHPVCYHGKFITTIPDLTLAGPWGRHHNLIKRLAFHVVMQDAVTRSLKVIAISHTTKKDIHNSFHVADNRVAVIYLGLDLARYHPGIKEGKTELRNVQKKYGLPQDYILYTGMWKPHKNLVRLLQAFARYKAEKKNDVRLVLTGKIDQNEPQVLAEMQRVRTMLAEQNQPDSIIATGFIREEDLPLVYAGALAYVMPSLAEGFGWPPLEAMACSTPVVSSQVSCMPEILGEAAYYFDPYDTEDMAEALGKILEDKELRTELTQKGLKQVQKYRWEDCARQTLNLYNLTLSR